MSEAQIISVVSPVYGCRDCLAELAKRVRAAFEGTAFDWELILVDDRGPDHPWPLIQELAAEDGRIRGVRLSRNHGQHLAIWAGLEAARGDWVAIVDCDLQDDPNVIPALHAQAVTEGVDQVIVDRGEWTDTGLRRMASRAFVRLIDFLAGIRLDNGGIFGIYSRRTVDILLMYREQEVFLPIMAAMTGLPRASYRLDRSDRAAGQSSYTFLRLIRMAVSIVIRISDRPLKLSVAVGLAFSGLSAFVSVIVLLAWMTGAFTVPGWTSLILSVWFLAGLILAVLGIHGFYMGRIFAEVQGRPRIIVEQTTEQSEP